MKKTVLLLLAAGCWMFANSQTNNNASGKPAAVRHNGRMLNIRPLNETGKGSTAFDASKVNHKPRPNRAMATLPLVQCGSAYNIFGVLDQSCSQVDVNPTLGLITVTHREDCTKTDGTGTYEVSYSKNGGAAWDSSIIILKGGSTGYRYPNGQILNPMGNTVDSLAYAVVGGPHTNGSTTWDTTAFGSVQLSLTGTNINQQTYGMYPGYNKGVINSYSPQQYMQVCNDSMVHCVAPAISLNASSVEDAWYGLQLWDGTWSTTPSPMITWKSSVLRPSFMSYYGTAPVDSGAEVLSTSPYVWSQDGMTGFIVIFGNLDSVGASFASLQPIVWKTTNAGATWTMLPVHNFKNDPVLTKYLRYTMDSATAKIPYWDVDGDGYHDGHGVDATVDKNGTLHIFGAIESGYYANPDSGGYTFKYLSTEYLYDTYLTSSGTWGSIFIDSLASPFGIELTQTPWTYNGGVVWGDRIQASRSDDGSRVFCTWGDDIFGLSGGDSTNISPGINCWGLNVSTNMMTAPTQLDGTGSDYYLSVSGKAYPTSCTGGSFWNIPTFIVANPTGATNDGSGPVDLLYVQNVGFCDNQFTVPTGINEVTDKTKAPFSVSPNYPNPFNRQTSFNINLTEASSVAVDVFNTVGQKVWSRSAETMAPGTHIINIDGSSLSAGVYYYRVIANGYAVTNKMIVE